MNTTQLKLNKINQMATIKAKQNDAVFRFYGKNFKIDEIHVQIEFESNWIVLGIEDLKNAIQKADKILALQKKLFRIESELDKCRTSTMQDGWQTQRHAKKSRKWDVLAQEKMNIIQQINDLENES